MLSPYRVLDLTDERGLLGGKILADLGADVIQIESPAGNPARRVGPFYRGEIHPERSLYWWAYAANKRGVTLDVATTDGRALLTRLVEKADFLIESGAPGALAALGLGWDALSEIKSALIMVSITPFGQAGPRSQNRATDLTGMAMAGFMYVTGDPDRPPVRVGFPHFWLHGAGAAATGAMIALAHRTRTGLGQHVDVSCQEAVARALANALPTWTVSGTVISRQGSYRQMGVGAFMRITWPCQDGFVNFQFSGGAGAGPSVNRLVQWMAEEGLGDQYLESLDFATLGYGTITPEMLERLVPPIERFLMHHTKQQLFEGAVARRILLFPVATPADILANPQLRARRYWEDVAHPDLEAPVTFPGPFVDASAMPVRRRRLAPKLGEHNTEIYVDELGLTPAELGRLRRIGAI